MSAEQLIALEAALAELSVLYAAARNFTALRQRAEAELLPRLLALGSELRGLLRAAQLSSAEIDRAAREIVALGGDWRAALDGVRRSAVYAAARAAFAADHQPEIVALVPQLFAGWTAVCPAPTLYFPVSPSTGRRKAGSSPFLSVPECADRVMRMLRAGIEPEDEGTEWWESELPSILCADAAGALDTPIALRLAANDVHVTVFASMDEPTLRIFTPRLHAPMSVVLATEATDEWWYAYEDSYRAFRKALEQELRARGIDVSEYAVSE